MKILRLALLLAVIAPFAHAAGDGVLPDGLYAEFRLARGPSFTVELDYRHAPMTVTSFVGLAEGMIAPRDGHPFFHQLKWYRVVPGFVIQSGDPDHERNRDKDDAGTPYTFPDEFVPGLRHDRIGVLSMANAGPDTNSCEFFVTLADCTRLNYLHSVFGHTVRGVETLPDIKPDDAFTIAILRVGPAAKAFKADEATFKALVARAGKYRGEPEPGPAAHFDDPDHLLPADPPRARNFNFKLANFERITGVRLVARVFAASPPPAEDEKPGAYMHALAVKLGVDRRGAVAAYFAADKDWRVWIGDESTAAFLGHPPAPADLVPEGPLHKIKTAFLDAAQAQGDAAFAGQVKATPAGQPPPAEAQHLKLQVDAMLDGLILRLEPKP